MAIKIRPMQESDLAIAAQVFRLAFGTFIGLPNPKDFSRTANYINRWYIDPSAAFVAEEDGRVIGSNIAANLGSFGTFGPLSVHPDYWNAGIGQRLVSAVMDYFSQHQISQLGLFTFPNSPKHLGLYDRFGFHPRCLTAVMTQTVDLQAEAASILKYSDLPTEQRESCLKDCAELTHTLFSGLDLSREIRTVAARGWGDTVLLERHARSNLSENRQIEGFAVCHCGEDTEAGAESCYIKFGAVRSGEHAAASLEALLEACAALARQRGLTRLVCGVNTERQGAYQLLRKLGYRIEILGVAMLKPNYPVFNQPNLFVLDDWR